VVAGTGASMMEVNPGLPAEDAAHLLTRTADPFLPARIGGDGTISPEEFHAQHGSEAG
jgi:hypothetical protein